MQWSLSITWNRSALNLQQMQLMAITKQTTFLKDRYKIWMAIPPEALSNATERRQPASMMPFIAHLDSTYRRLRLALARFLFFFFLLFLFFLFFLSSRNF